MALESLANDATTTNVGSVTAGATSLTVASSSNFPSTPFRCAWGTLSSGTFSPTEIVSVTNVSGTTWTITRGVEAVPGSGAGSGVTHASGETLMAVVTAAGLLAALADTTVASTQAFGDAAAAGTASGLARIDHKHAMPAAELPSGYGKGRILVGVTSTTSAWSNAANGTAPVAGKGASSTGAGSGDYIANGSDTGLPAGTAAWTIECWFKVSTTGSSPTVVCWGSNAAGGHMTTVRLQSNTQISIVDGSHFNRNFTAGASVADGAWHHLVVTFDGTNGACYLDNVAVGTSGALSPNLSTVLGGATAFYIGNQGGANDQLNGSIDEVAIYGAVLSTTRIAAHFNAKTDGTYVSKVMADTPLRYYSLEETTGTTAVDNAGNANLTYSASHLTLGVTGAVSVNPSTTVAASSGAGTSPPTPTVAGNDTRGTVNMGTGTSPGTGAQALVTFSATMSDAPTVVISPLNSATAALQPYVSSVTTSSFTVSFGVAPTASQGLGTYQVAYHVLA